ncbi:cysteine desulfurase family protein [Enterococcus sp. HY326]|uniref:cysteine desulfurase family protein n=1 Tax=Enterococcus sp. HY326 TaxID=2971265 RepID=UPI00223EB61D|nr:cysteine desulfurase family protein [Enterococcus sp. HY326]
MSRMYFDHAATTPMAPEVIDAVTQVMKEVFGNPSSIHQFGRQAHEYLENARQTIASSLQVKPHEIIFNSGGTEGDNTAIIETALARQNFGKHLITTAIEHPAVLNTMKYLETLGFEVTYLPVDQKGNLAVADFQKALREDTILVSIMYVNNETGNILPIPEIGAILKHHPAYFHADAVQAYGLLEINPHEIGIDLLSVSAHKFNGPKGVGFLFKTDAIQLPPFLHGGEQEEKRRAGTENLAGIVGMSQAVSLLKATDKNSKRAEFQQFQTVLLKQLEAAGIPFEINGDVEQATHHVLNLRFPGVRNDLLLMKLDLQGIAISTGSACTAGTVDPSHVLEAMYGKGNPTIKESVRISFGSDNTLAEVEELAAKLIAILTKK